MNEPIYQFLVKNGTLMKYTITYLLILQKNWKVFMEKS